MTAISVGQTKDIKQRCYSKGHYSSSYEPFYNFRLSVKLDSQSRTSNSSTVTIGLGLAINASTGREVWDYNAKYGPWYTLQYSVNGSSWVNVRSEVAYNNFVSASGGIDVFKTLDTITTSIPHSASGVANLSVRLIWEPRSNGYPSNYLWDPNGLPPKDKKLQNIEITLSDLELPIIPKIYVSNGSAWVTGIPYISNGSAWTTGTVKVSDGTKWST